MASPNPTSSAERGAASIEEACTLLSGGYDEWERRCAVIASVPGLLGATAAGELEQAMKALVDPFSKQLADLRSATVRAACDTLCTVAETHTAACAPLASGVLPKLLENTYVTVKVISQESGKAAAYLVAHAPSKEMIKALLHATKDEHHQARTSAVALLGQLAG